MSKKIRKAVRTFLIQDEKIVAIKYKCEHNRDYYDIPGGKIEPDETSAEASVREFKEETGMDIIKQQYKGNVIVEYSDKIFDFDIYVASDYEKSPLNFEENDSMWIEIVKLLHEKRKFPSIEIIKYLNSPKVNLRIFADEQHNIIKIEKI